MKLKNLVLLTTFDHVQAYYGHYQRPTGIPITTAVDWENWGITQSNDAAGHQPAEAMISGSYDQYDLIKDYSNYKEWTQDEWNLAYRAFQETLLLFLAGGGNIFVYASTRPSLDVDA